MMNIISLGAGVQSSTIALMVERGELDSVEAAVFADTGDEPRKVMQWLAWLETQLSYPIIRVSVGKLSLSATAVRRSAKAGYLKPSIPVFFDRDQKKGKGQRHCTVDFKITPILRAMASMRGMQQVRQYIGISTDEADRMKPAPRPWVENYYPLIEKGMSRGHCLEWMRDHGYPEPPKSACKYCPFHSDAAWIQLRDHEPEEFAEAVAFERLYQSACAQTGLDGVPYLHVDRVPLSEVVFDESRQKDMFSSECFGMCGV